MKKIISLILCLMLVAGLSACGKTVSEDYRSAEVSSEAWQVTTEEKEISSEVQETEQSVEEQQAEDNYVASVVITINPRIKLYLDTENVIVGVEYLNEDAKTAFSEISLSGTSIEEGIEKIVETAIDKEFLTDGKDVSIEITEIKDESYDSSGVCTSAEEVAVNTLKDRGVEANVSAQVTDATEQNQEIEEAEEPAQESVTSASTEEIAEVSESEASETEEISETQESAPTLAETEEKTQEICSTCGGTGKCDECKGDGYRGSGYTVSCPRCNGSLTETCIYCDANGNSNKHEGTCDFPNCMGSHVYACTTCGGGTTPVTCKSCSGSGKCKTCGGSGTK